MKGCLDLGDKAFLVAISQHLLVQEFSSMAEISFFIFIESKSVSLSPSPSLPSFCNLQLCTSFYCQRGFSLSGETHGVWGCFGHCSIGRIYISYRALFFVSSLSKALVSSD